MRNIFSEARFLSFCSKYDIVFTRFAITKVFALPIDVVLLSLYLYLFLANKAEQKKVFCWFRFYLRQQATC